MKLHVDSINMTSRYRESRDTGENELNYKPQECSPIFGSVIRSIVGFVSLMATAVAVVDADHRINFQHTSAPLDDRLQKTTDKSR